MEFTNTVNNNKVLERPELKGEKAREVADFFNKHINKYVWEKQLNSQNETKFNSKGKVLGVRVHDTEVKEGAINIGSFYVLGDTEVILHKRFYAITSVEKNEQEQSITISNAIGTKVTYYFSRYNNEKLFFATLNKEDM